MSFIPVMVKLNFGSLLKTVVLFDIFVETDLFFQDSLTNRKFIQVHESICLV